MNNPNKHVGLSPSSMALFQTCQRRYFHKKVASTAPDSNGTEDTEALDIGKAFHKALEDTRHDLTGYEIAKISEVAGAHGLDEEFHVPLLYTMLQSYHRVHQKAGLKVLACEVEIATPEFYGFADVILEDPDGGLWVGDMKTAASFNSAMVPTLPLHPQLNLYAFHFPQIAEMLGLDATKFRGCRYRLTTKSKIARREHEDTNAYIGRLSKTVQTYDFIIPKELMQIPAVKALHSGIFTAVEVMAKLGTAEAFTPNFGACFQYFRPCEYFSQCHGRAINMIKLEAVTA